MKTKYLELAEKIFVIISLTFFTGGFGIGATETKPGILSDTILTVIRYFIWLTSSLLICLNWQTALRTASRDKILWILTAIVLLSFLWSDNQILTLLDSREVWQMTTFGLYLATRFSLKEQVKLIAWTFSIGALLSIVVALGLPAIGKHGADHPGAWKGIYDYKNTFGSMMVMSAFAFLLLPLDKANNHLYKWLGFGLSVAMILVSTSRTSLIVFGLILSFVWFYRNFRWQGKITVLFLDIFILLLSCVGIAVVVNWVVILTGLGRDPTLTGRTILWDFIATKIQERPFLGYGRGAFWAEGSRYAIEAGELVANSFVAPHAHNGFLDLGLDVGYIGLALFLISFTTGLFWAMKRAYANQNPEEVWPLVFLLFLAMNNMTESYLLRLANVYWVLYVTVILTIKQRRPNQRLKI
ncbi:MAG: O-antigen ligase family protein [Goleter apudmare HA4340-LM2]|jgi:O-antigen ligase|nr:O-antigen ligase family protein [Goleter apudmare HA4340-LM2]